MLDVDGGSDDDGTDDGDNNDRGDDGVVDKTSHGVDDRSSKKATSATETQNMQTWKPFNQKTCSQSI